MMYNFRADQIIFILGAGASADAGIPVSSKMIDKLEKLFQDDHGWKEYSDLYYLVKSGIKYACGVKNRPDSFNIESLIVVLNEMIKKEEHPLYPFIGSWNIRFNEIIRSNYELIISFRNEIHKELKDWVDLKAIDEAKYFSELKRLRDEYNYPLRIFTLNYDLCIEKVLTRDGVSYERGFNPESKSWNHKRFFLNPNDNEADLYLYKIHGSIDWERDSNTKIVKYCDGIARTPDLIFGSQYKLQYVDPYLFLFSELRHHSLNAKLIICIGYSFSDEHVNGLLSQALKQDSSNLLYCVSKSLTVEDIHRTLDVNRNKVVLSEYQTAKEFITKIKMEEIAKLFINKENDEEPIL